MKETRDKIIKQALNYIACNDYEKASLNSIAKAIGITKGGIYHYFDSKEDLFKECLIFLFDTLDEIMNEVISGTEQTTPEILINSFFSMDVLIEMITKKMGIDLFDDYSTYLYLLSLGFKKFPELKKRVSSIYKNSRKEVETQLKIFQDKNQIRKDIDCSVYALQLISLGEGFMMLCAIDHTIDLKIESEGIIKNLLICLK